MRRERMKDYGTFFYSYHSIKTDSVHFPETKKTAVNKNGGDSLTYINQEDIQEVIFSGYRDEDETIMQTNICMAVGQMKGHRTAPAGEASPAKNA